MEQLVHFFPDLIRAQSLVHVLLSPSSCVYCSFKYYFSVLVAKRTLFCFVCSENLDVGLSFSEFDIDGIEMSTD